MAVPQKEQEKADPMPEEMRREFVDGRAEAGPTGRGEYQVWHDRGWPQSRIDQMLGGAPSSRFPEDYFHAASVRAGSLREAVEKTTHRGDPAFGDAPFQPWNQRAGVVSFTPKPFLPRDTDTGDVIVDPQGKPHRYDGHGFSEIKAMADSRLPSPGDIANSKDGPEPPERGMERRRGR